MLQRNKETDFSAYVTEIARSPQKLITFHMDGILGIFLELEDGERDSCCNDFER